jgi:hypothetical protein
MGLFQFYDEDEWQRRPGRVDPLETVDLHDPLGPLGDRESSIQRRSKKPKRLKKLKRIDKSQKQSNSI